MTINKSILLAESVEIQDELIGLAGGGRDEVIGQAEAPDIVPELHENALYGLAGSIVKDIDPYCEADPKATLLHALIGFGNMVGDASYTLVGAERHSAKISAVLVGPTAAGRKGSAWRPIKAIFQRADSEWIENRVKSGLSSGEGIIYHLRDAEGDDSGVEDKRLLAIEPEFGSTLKIMSREGNSLSGVIRQAWDDGNLSTLTKNAPLKATGTHFSLIGHTTSQELLRFLDGTERANGFANRLLWFLVRRSKFLPDGDPIPAAIIDNLADRVADAAAWAKGGRYLKRDPLAAELWRRVYAKLEAERPGMSGAILSRGAAQTLRLSLVYALLDKSPVIRTEHLKAALALWDVSERSVLSIFGDRTGDPVADRILDTVRARGEMTRDEILTLFHRHNPGGIGRALELLEKFGRIRKEMRPTAGRPVTVYCPAT